MFLRRKGLIGLDIGSNTVKLVELQSTKSGYQLKNVGQTVLPRQSIVNKVIQNHDAVAEAISSLIDDLKIKTKNVAISISGHSVIIKKVSLPKMSESELRESIPWELEQYLPQSIEDVNYDYQVIPGETPEGNIDVLIVAAKKDVTNSYVSIVKEVGLNPVVVDVDVFALENMYEINYMESEDLVALVNIGASVTNINILKGGVSIFTRDITTGGNQFTEWIMNELGLEYEEAEKMKFTPPEEESSSEVGSLRQDFIELISGEIKRTLEFFSSTLWTGKVNNILIGGGSSMVPGLKETLADLNEAKVEFMNPFRSVTYDKGDFDPEYIESIAPMMSVVMGLASRKPGDKQ
ncbi:MAG: type IV pilus assembly protein PilM [Deltaproteobacteria bacterium]